MAENPISQRDYMRGLLLQFGRDRDTVCTAYAEAERNGIVQRRKNVNDTSAEGYATALWKDGVRRGWLPEK